MLTSPPTNRSGRDCLCQEQMVVRCQLEFSLEIGLLHHFFLKLWGGRELFGKWSGEERMHLLAWNKIKNPFRVITCVISVLVGCPVALQGDDTDPGSTWFRSCNSPCETLEPTWKCWWIIYVLISKCSYHQQPPSRNYYASFLQTDESDKGPSEASIVIATLRIFCMCILYINMYIYTHNRAEVHQFRNTSLFLEQESLFAWTIWSQVTMLMWILGSGIPGCLRYMAWQVGVRSINLGIWICENLCDVKHVVSPCPICLLQAKASHFLELLGNRVGWLITLNMSQLDWLQRVAGARLQRIQQPSGEQKLWRAGEFTKCNKDCWLSHCFKGHVWKSMCPGER